MGALDVGKRMVEMVNQGRVGEEAFVKAFYSENIISIEGQGSEDMPMRMEGIAAIHGKHAWWYDNNTVHGVTVEGPFVGHRPDQFVLRLEMDITPNNGARMTMTEVGLYTVASEKVVQEEYLYLMG